MCIVVVILHVLHNRLLVNIRMYLRERSVIWSLLGIWGPFNLLICKLGRGDGKGSFHGLEELCQEKLCAWKTIVKVLIVGTLYVYTALRLSGFSDTVYLSEEWHRHRELSNDCIFLGQLLVAYALQIPILLGFRFLFFICIQIFCCGCACINTVATEKIDSKKADPF